MSFRLLRRIKNRLRRDGSRWSSAPEPPAFTAGHPAYAADTVGRRTYGTPLVHRWPNDSRLVIGSYCSIATGVQILLGGEHVTEWGTTYPFAELIPEAVGARLIGRSKGDVHIGSDVWIGHDAIILSGVTIGSGAVIGARCVVTKDVAPYAIVGGNPARFIRHRIAPEFIPAMLKIAWWDWPETRIIGKLPLLLSPDIRSFVAGAEAEVFEPASPPEATRCPL
jgi:acetyltransferase-like isoleucine patch superfamily enzyme